MLHSTLVAFLANNIWFTRALASLNVTVQVDRAFSVAVAGLKLKPYLFEERKKLFKNVEGSRLVFGRDNFQLFTCLTSLSRESVVFASTLVTILGNNIWFTGALASLDVTVLVDRAFRVTVARLKLLNPSFIPRTCSKTNQKTFTAYLTSVSIIH